MILRGSNYTSKGVKSEVILFHHLDPSKGVILDVSCDYILAFSVYIVKVHVPITAL